MMIKLMTTAAAAMLATAAFAQSTSGSGMSPASDSMASGSMSKDAMAKGGMMDDGMSMKNGKMMMGDRRATRAEIAAHKKMMKSHDAMMKHDKMAK